MDDGAGYLLTLVGAVALIAALVGGNLKLPGHTEFPPLRSGWIRTLLALCGLAFFACGIALITGVIGPNENRASPSPGPINTNSAAPTPTLDPSPTQTPSPDVNGDHLARIASICTGIADDLTGLSDDPSSMNTAGQSFAEGSDQVRGTSPPPDSVYETIRLADAMYSVSETLFIMSQAASVGDAYLYEQYSAFLQGSMSELHSSASAIGVPECLLD